MGLNLGDTICAVATPSGGAARGMVRISGPASLAIAARLFEADHPQRISQARRASALSGTVRFSLDGIPEHTSNSPRKASGETAAIAPCDLFLWPTARSYTREPVAELHTLGSPPILEALVTAACREGARLAEPGEFTLRAFLAGRLDLTQAEAVLGVIDARGGAELAGALNQLAGGVARPLHQLREDLLQLLAELEAGLDFVEEDIEFVTPEEAVARLTAATKLLDGVQRQMQMRDAGERTAQVVLVGDPNVGKSSLFNALVKRFGARSSLHSGRAIVSPIAGTTRDYLTAMVDLSGISCHLVDTAGVDEAPSAHEVNRAAQLLAKQRHGAAALRLYCIEAARAHQTAEQLTASYDVIVLTKSDIDSPANRPQAPPPAGIPLVQTSSRTGAGLDELGTAIRALLLSASAEPAMCIVSATAERCRESIRHAEAAVQRATEIVAGRHGDELAAAELRLALEELGRVVGAVYTDDLLDRIFSKFCIGK